MYLYFPVLEHVTWSYRCIQRLYHSLSECLEVKVSTQKKNIVLKCFIYEIKIKVRLITSFLYINESISSSVVFLDNDLYFILQSKTKHVISRSNGDLIILDDKSISRSHANLELKNERLFLIDLNSKYGTYLNNGIETKTRIKPNVQIELKCGDNIKFGQLSCDWIVDEFKVNTLASQLKIDQRTNLIKTLDQIGGKLITDFKDDCTHLTMDNIAVTIKVLQALIMGIPIVTSKYWKALFDSIKNEKLILSFRNFMPPISEGFLRANNEDFYINKNRKTLFKDLKFYFMLKRHMDSFENVINMAGMMILMYFNIIHL